MYNARDTRKSPLIIYTINVYIEYQLWCWELPCLVLEAVTPPWLRLSKKTLGP